jgi:hypothetical protein
MQEIQNLHMNRVSAQEKAKGGLLWNCHYYTGNGGDSDVFFDLSFYWVVTR